MPIQLLLLCRKEKNRSFLPDRRLQFAEANFVLRVCAPDDRPLVTD